jgi:hypothetical protein
MVLHEDNAIKSVDRNSNVKHLEPRYIGLELVKLMHELPVRFKKVTISKEMYL